MKIATWRMKDLYKADAQKVADEIASIGESATPQQIVEKARDTDTELHKCLEWRDDVAAEKYRVIQARDIVHQLVFEEKEVPEDRPPIRLFYKPDGADGYKKVEHIVVQEDSYQNLLKAAYAELQAFKRKYACLSELEAILALIDEI